jgi:tetratricopeptide (TPR) repeat protein/nucleoside phosphorylase
MVDIALPPHAGNMKAHEDYTVAIVCPLELEMSAMRYMLDREHPDLPRKPGDPNLYVLGEISGYNIVLAWLPGNIGKGSAAAVVTNIERTFTSITWRFLVGIGGGAPSEKHDIRLGDVVVSMPEGQYGGVVQYDLGKDTDHGFQLKGFLAAPPASLRGAAIKMKSDHLVKNNRIEDFIATMLQKGERLRRYLKPDGNDVLFDSEYPHASPGSSCASCDRTRSVNRRPRGFDGPVIHYGLIASGDRVIKSAVKRDLNAALGEILCFEMEAAGPMTELPCIVIRGISDYADTHKNDAWQCYAAATAAACTKELLTYAAPIVMTRRDMVKTHFMVPLGRNNEFVGREDSVTKLLQTVPPNANKFDCQRNVIEGLGGIGKTQIALEVSYRLSDAFSECSIFWIPAVTVAMFESALRDIGKLLNLPGIEEDGADCKTLVKAALERSIQDWVLIIDNADDIDLCFDRIDGLGLGGWLPFSRNGSILFTTRNHRVSIRLDVSTEYIVAVKEMNNKEATNLLKARLKEAQLRDGESTDILLDCLAHLPLAIKQASAYMTETGISTSTYLQYYRESDQERIELLGRDFDDRGRYPGTMNAMTTTWLISFDHISQRFPLAAAYLKFICFLAEKNIPKSLLPSGNSSREKHEAIAALEGYAFITEREDGDSFDIHRLIRFVMRSHLKGEDRIHTITSVIQHLSEIYPYPEYENRDVWRQYMPHAVTAMGVCEEIRGLYATHIFLDRMAQTYHLTANYKKAEQIHSMVISLREQMLSRKDPRTISSINGLALALGNQGRYEKANQLHRQALELCIESAGPEHRKTLRYMNNLAIVLGKQGQHGEAEKMHRQTLKLFMQVSGPEHLDTLTSQHNFASTLSSQGKHKEAEQLGWQTFESRERILGPEHPNTLESVNNLGNTLANQGKYKEAEQLHWQTLQLTESVLGPEHPNTFSIRNNLAVALYNQGRYEEAERLYWQTLELRGKVLGSEHPDTLGIRNNLASTLHCQGRYEEAEQLYRQMLKLPERILGPEHPHSLRIRNNLARTLHCQGRYEEVEQLYRQILKLAERILGPEHPDTFGIWNNLAVALYNQGRYEEAGQLYRQILKLAEMILVPEHPVTRCCRRNLQLFNSYKKPGASTPAFGLTISAQLSSAAARPRSGNTSHVSGL